MTTSEKTQSRPSAVPAFPAEQTGGYSVAGGFCRWVGWEAGRTGGAEGRQVAEQRRIHDAARLGALRDTGLLERPPVPGLDRLTKLAAQMLSVPTALVSLITDRAQ